MVPNVTSDDIFQISSKEHYYKSGHSVMEHLNVEWKIIFSVLFSLVCVTGALLNATVLRALHRYNELQTQSNKILAALATTDLCTSVLVAPLNVLQLANTNMLYIGHIYITRTFMTTLFVLASDYITTFISFDRCLHIIKLNNYELDNRTLYSVLTLCLLLPCITSILLPLQQPKLFVYMVNVEIWIILLVVVVFYTMLLVALRKYTARNENILNESYVRDQARAARTVIMIVTMYILMRLPVVISFFVVMTNRYYLSFNTKFYTISNFLCVSNSLVNPLIYGYRTSLLRQHIKKLFRVKCCETFLRVECFEKSKNIELTMETISPSVSTVA